MKTVHEIREEFGLSDISDEELWREYLERRDAWAAIEREEMDAKNLLETARTTIRDQQEKIYALQAIIDESQREIQELKEAQRHIHVHIH